MLDVDIESMESICVPCQDQSFSTGSNLLYSKESANLNEMVENSVLFCGVFLNGNVDSSTCFDWKYNVESGYIEAGQVNSGIDSQALLVYEMDYMLYSEEASRMNLTFNFDSKQIGDSKFSGLMKMYLNYDLVYISSKNTPNFTTVSFPIIKGINELTIIYQRSNTINCTKFRARIKSLVIENGVYGPYSCIYCPKGTFSNLGKTSCESCKRNFYINDNEECVGCPESTYSFVGSRGVNSCLSLPVCTDAFMEAQYSTCMNGTIYITYSWQISKPCTGGVLPDNTSLPCTECKVGSISVTENGVRMCKRCDDGM